MATTSQTGTRVDEIAPDIYRIHTPVQLPGGQAFSFNQYLLVDEDPLLFHTGPRKLFPRVSEAIARVLPLQRLRWIGLSHVEADECGAMNEFLAVAPRAEALCGQIAAMVSMNDLADRPARALADGELLSLGRHELRWFDTPHTPHGWECGLMLDTTTRTFFCGDLFTQPGADQPALSESDILGPSEAFRQAMDYFAHAPQTAATLQRLARQCRRAAAGARGLPDAVRHRGARAGLIPAVPLRTPGQPGHPARKASRPRAGRLRASTATWALNPCKSGAPIRDVACGRYIQVTASTRASL